MRRSLPIDGLAGLVLVLLLAAPASANRIQFLWQATGTDRISVLPGAQVVLEAWMEVGSLDLFAASVSALATPGLLTATEAEVCPSGCSAGGFSTLSPVGTQQIVLNQQNTAAPDFEVLPGLSGSFSATASSLSYPAPAGSTFLLAEITYQVIGVGSGEVLPYYRGGIDGVTVGEVGDAYYFLPLGDGADLVSGASFMVVPEPATAATLSLGLAALALCGRGRRPGRPARDR